MRDARPQRALRPGGRQARRRAHGPHRLRARHRRGRRRGQPLAEGARGPRRRHPDLRGVRRRLPGPGVPGAARRPRPGGLRGRHRHPDQPRDAGDHDLGAAPHGGPGHHHRRGRHRLPRRVPGRVPQAPGRDGHREDDVLLVHLRPPRHPGRRLGPPPGAHRPEAVGARRLLRARLHLHARAHPPLQVGGGLRVRPRAGEGQGGAHRRAHPRLPLARAPRRRHRPPVLPRSPPPRPGALLLRPVRVGPRPPLPRRRPRGRPDPPPARDPRPAARHLHAHGRHRVHAHPGPRPAPVGAVPHREALLGPRRRRAGAHPGHPDPRGGVRGVPPDQVHGPEALLPGGRGVPDPPARRAPLLGGPGGDPRGGHRHGPPRAPQRPGQHCRQVLLADLRRVRGQLRGQPRPGQRRREVPPGHVGRVLRGRRHGDEGVHGRQPLAPGGRRRRPRGHRPRQAGRPGRPGPADHPRPHPRGRGVRRAGRRPGDPQHEPGGGLQDGRDDPRDRRQPDRLHHRPGLRALHPLRHGPGQGPADPHPARQRRRPRGGGAAPASPSSTAAASTRTSSSTWCATAGAATTRATTPR